MRILPIIIIALIINLVAFHAKAQDTKYIDSLKTVLKTAKNDTNKLKILSLCSEYYFKKEDKKSVLHFSEKILELAKLLNKKKAVASTYCNMGEVYKSFGNVDESINYYTKAMEIWEQTKDQKHKAMTMNEMGLVYVGIGKYSEGIKQYLNALRIYENLYDEKAKANTYGNLGTAYRLVGNPNDAIQMYSKALELHKLNKNKKGMASVFNGLANAYKNSNNLDQAESLYLEALSINKEMGNRSWESINIQGIANILKIKGENSGDTVFARQCFLKAKKLYLECLDINLQSQIKSNIITNYVNLGGIDTHLGLFDEALENLQKAVAISIDSKQKAHLRSTYENISTVYQQMALGNYKMNALMYWPIAYEYHIKATELKDSLLNETTTKQIAELKTQYETEKKDNQILLLGKENALQLLQLKQKQSDLLLARLEAEQRQADIELLEQTQEIEHLKLNEANQLAEQQELKAKAAISQVALLQKDKLIKEQEQKQKSLLRNSIFAGITALLLFSGIFIVYRNRNLARIRLSTIRQEISKDLHDDVGGSLSLIRMMSEMIGQQKDLPAPIAANAQKIVESTKDAAQRMNAVIWSMNAENDTLSSFIEYSRHFGYGFFEHCAIDCAVTLNPLSMPQKQLNGLIRKNLFLVLKEAWNNVFKHAQATAVQTTFTLDQNKLLITIEDNGKGFGNHSAFGNGLKNMQKRMEAIGGSFHIANNDKGKGTIVSINLVV